MIEREEREGKGRERRERIVIVKEIGSEPARAELLGHQIYRHYASKQPILDHKQLNISN
jgi:hypothetical protein